MSFPMDDVKSTISDLPEEVLLEVFSYLTHFDIFQNVRNVCVGWKHLSECACLWKCIDVRKVIQPFGSRCYDDEIEREIKLFESWLEAISCHVLSLYIGYNFDWFVRFVQNNPLIVFPKVTKLEIALTNFDTDDIITKLFPNVRDLSLQFDIATIDDFLHTLQNVYILRNLECIELSCGINYLSSNDTEENEITRAFKRFLQSRPNLTHITSNILTNSSVKALLSYCQKLEYLDIGWCVLVNIAAFDSMPFKHSLVTLNMDYTHIDEQCLKIITQNAPNLRHLSLKRSDGVYEITDVGLSYVGTHCTKLETLNIDRYAKATGRNLTNVGIDYIARGCKHLKVLAVRNCNGITDEGIQSIAEHCHNMSILKVGGCTGITGTGVKYLAYGCRSLRHVEFDGCIKVTYKCINHLIVNCIWLETVILDSRNINTLKFKNFLLADNCLSSQGFVRNDRQIKHNLCLQGEVKSSPSTNFLKLLNYFKSLTIINEHMTNVNAVASNHISADKTASKSSVNTLENASCKNTEGTDIIPQALKINNGIQDTAPRHSHMRILRLNFCPNIGDDSVKEIADFCPELRELYLSETFLITDTSIQYLLKKCVILEVLDISGGQTLTKSALTDNVLISIGNYGKNLQQLTIHNNDKITIFGIRELLRTSTSLKSVSFTARHKRKTRLGISLHDCESIVEELGKYNATLKRDIELNNQGLYVISIIIKNNCQM
jgi:hypothetical protein